MIHRECPALVCAPHVETSLGILLPDDYVRGVAEAVRDVDGVFCLDGIASGTAWVDMGSSASTATPPRRRRADRARAAAS